MSTAQVIAKSGLAFASVTEAQAKRRMARGGKLDINIDYVKFVSGDKAALRAIKDVKGGGHTGAMVGDSGDEPGLFPGGTILPVQVHGKDIAIPKGTEITAYVNGDLKLDTAKFQPANTPQSAGAYYGGHFERRKTAIGIKAGGTDIELDGNFRRKYSFGSAGV